MSMKPEIGQAESGHKLGRIKGKWEDSMRSLAPDHSEANWNRAAQEAVDDGHIDSESEAQQAADWLKNYKFEDQADPVAEEPVDDAYDPPSKALGKARAYVAAKDETDLSGDTTQSIFGYNPVSGAEGYETSEGKGIADNFMHRYRDNLTEQMTGKKSNSVSEEIANQAKTKVSEQTMTTMGMP